MSYIQFLYGKVENNNKTTKLTNFPQKPRCLSLVFRYLNDINDTEFNVSLLELLRTEGIWSGTFELLVN